MKKIFAGILTAAMLLCSAVIPASAAGTLVHSDDFAVGFAAKNWGLTGTAFKWDNEGFIYGYGDARVLETRYGSRDEKVFDQFYTSFDVKICDFDDLNPSEVTGNHVFGFWYRDLFENESGSQGCVYQFFIEAETGDAYILKSTYDGQGIQYRDENNILQTLVLAPVKICEGNIGGPVPVGDDAPYVNIGMRVTEGRIEGYYNEKLVCFAEVDPEGEKVGDTYIAGVDPTVGSQKSPILFWSGLDGDYTGKLYVHLDNFEVWTPDYDFQNTMYGDADGNGKISLADASMILKHLAKYELENFDAEAADVNSDTKINLGDASLLLKYIAKWDVVLGPTE